jgi:flagellar biosynthesis anti-sigma factor FlgM
MSNTIPPFRQASLPDNATGQTAVPAAAPAPEPAAPPQTDSVTLSPAAQSGAQLLTAAQEDSGINQEAVAAIRAQLAEGSYNVSPENLAQAIATVLKETKP